MNNDLLPTIYLSALILFLLVIGAAVLRQVFKTRQLESTFSKLQKQVKQDNATAKEYYELGSIYLDKKLYLQAIKLLKNALKKSEEEQSENLALIYNALGYAYFSQEQYDLAIRQYKEAINCVPDYITALNNLGNAYEKKQLFVQAIETYDIVLETEPKNDTAKRRASSLRKRLVTS